MAVITLGSYNQIEPSVLSPIDIPVDELPIEQVILLRNPLLIRRSTTSGSSDSFWLRNDSGYLQPATSSDKVVINGTSFVSTEKLRVVGDINATSFKIGTGVTISKNSNDLIFTDPNAGTFTLTQLASGIGSIYAEDVIVEDSHGVFSATNVEDILYELYLRTTTTLHVHSNLSLLETYDQLNSDITSAVSLKHNAVTLGTPNGLLLDQQILSLGLASTNTIGALSDTDWNTFNSKLDTTVTLDAIKALSIVANSIIIGTANNTADVLSGGSIGEVIGINESGDLDFITVATGDTQFEVRKYPDETYYTSITNELGDINNTKYPDVSTLNGKTLKEVLQEMLFPTPATPTFVIPTESITSVTKGTSTNFSGYYVIKGSSSTITINNQLNTSIGPGGNAYAIVDGSATYEKDATSFSNGDSVTFTANTTFEVSQPWVANPSEYVVLGGGVTKYAEDYIGYPSDSGDRIALSTQVFTVVDPTYYGSFTAGTSTFPSAPTNAEITSGSTKLIATKPSTVSITVSSYTGSVDTHKYITVFYPASYGNLSRIDYVEGGNSNVIGSFTGPVTATYTRPDATTVSYYLYYALNSYTNITGTVTYIARF